MRTSCALGGRTCTSSMDSGSFGAQAIAALFRVSFLTPFLHFAAIGGGIV